MFERFRPFAWPETGSILLDHIPFRVTALGDDGKPKPGGKIAFDVFAAMGYEHDRPMFIRFEAFSGASAENWVRFLTGGALTGQPTRIVTDGHPGTIDGAHTVWPDARLYRSEWHLMHSVEKKLIAAKAHGNAKLMGQFRQASINRNFWEQFRIRVHRLKLAEVEHQLDVVEPFIEECWRTRPDEKDRRINPVTTGGLERRMDPVSKWLDERAHLMTNKRRLDRLLMLMQLHLDSKASQTAYTTAIRDWLSTRGGHASARRLVADPADALSLHDGIRPAPERTDNNGRE